MIDEPRPTQAGAHVPCGFNLPRAALRLCQKTGAGRAAGLYHLPPGRGRDGKRTQICQDAVYGARAGIPAGAARRIYIRPHGKKEKGRAHARICCGRDRRARLHHGCGSRRKRAECNGYGRRKCGAVRTGAAPPAARQGGSAARRSHTASSSQIRMRAPRPNGWIS